MPRPNPCTSRPLPFVAHASGESHPDYASSLNNLGALYDEMGRYAEAEPLYRQSLMIRRSTIGESHAYYGISLENLACLFAAQGRAKEAAQYMQRATEVDDRMIGHVFSIASERQKIEFMRTLMGKFFAYISLVLGLQGFPGARADGPFLVLRRKGIVAETVAIQRISIVLNVTPPWRNDCEQ